ncbi:MAG: tetratricopeptide repeat protein [Armatimonadetes bacterium]|nr:tetratricopeptide repeat protein [Armatimonadota bacterium]
MTMRLIATVFAVIALLVAGAPAQAQPLPPLDTSRLYANEAAFSRAIQPYQQAIAANPRNARAHYWLGFAYLYGYRLSQMGTAPFASGYLAKAVPPLQEAIKLDPNMLAALLALQDAYLMMGELEKADDVTQRLLKQTRPGWFGAAPKP